MQQRSDFIKNLPSVNTRIRTALPHSNTISMNTTDPRQSMKKSTSLAHTSKIVSYQTTGIIYVKRGEQQKLRLKNLQEEIKDTERQIEHRRKTIAEKKRVNDFILKPKVDELFMTDAEQQTIKAGSYRKNMNMNNPKELKNEIGIVTNKVAHLKKKLNTWLNDNRSIQTQIDVCRRQIMMYEQLNTSLQTEISKMDARFEEVWTQSKFVNEDVAMKHQELAKRKISKVHEETHLIKQYDEILKTVQKEMEIDRLHVLAGEKPNFYMTEVNMMESKSPTKKPAPYSPNRRKRLSKPLNELISELRIYDEAFKKIKSESNSDNLDEISKRFKQQYETNFRLYKYINNMNDELNRQMEEQIHLKERLDEARKQTRINHTKIKEQQIEQTKKELQQVLQRKQSHQKQITECTRILKDLKLSLPTICSRLGITPQHLSSHNLDPDNIQDKQLISYLQLIEKRKAQLMANTDSTTLTQSKAFRMNVSDFEEQMDVAKKEFNHAKERRDVEYKYNKFQEREDFIKGIEETHKFKKLRIKK